MNEIEKNVPAVVAKRLPRYYRYLSELLSSGVNRISSGELSSLMNVTASQIRQDFNYFGGFGQQGYGYNVEYLHKTIGEILGLDKGNSAIVIGVGNLGRAIANHDQFEKRGFKIAALFDIDENIVGKQINGKNVYHTDELEKYLESNKTDIAILTVPVETTQDVADRVIACGISGLLNFSDTEIKTEKGISVENVHFSDALMMLSYRLKYE